METFFAAFSGLSPKIARTSSAVGLCRLVARTKAACVV